MVMSEISSFCARVAGRGCATAALPLLFRTDLTGACVMILAGGEWQRSRGGKVPPWDVVFPGYVADLQRVRGSHQQRTDRATYYRLDLRNIEIGLFSG
jgi:hypothetical protein